MDDLSMPSSLIQPQISWNAGAILGPHFGNLNYLLDPKTLDPAPDKTYQTNQKLWEDIISERLRAHVTLLLEEFYLFEWFPRSPGLYYTPEALQARRKALRHLDYRFAFAPIGIDHAEELTGASRQADKADYRLVFTPTGKSSMLQGGIGCIRLKPIQKGNEIFWLMSASSSGIAHEGFPLAVPNQFYHAYIGEILEMGAVRCNIIGELKFLPDPFSRVFDYYPNVPPLYLEVKDIRPAPLLRRVGVPQTEVSVAVSFVSDFERQGGIYASYVTFMPGEKHSFQEAIAWLKHAYIEGGYKGRILTDFDQIKTHFPEAALSLRKVMGRHIRRGELEEAIKLMHAYGDVDWLFEQLETEELRANLSSIARTRVFISYSHNDAKWLERVHTHLKPLVREHNIEIWDDTKIRPGSTWREELESAIESANVAILLISANFLASDFISEFELPRLLEAAQDDGAIILPLVVSAARYAETPALGQLQAVNDPEKPLDTLPEGEQEQVLLEVSRQIERVMHLPS